MMDEYNEKYYSKLAVRAIDIKADNCNMARDIAEWKMKVKRHWEEIEVRSVKVPDSTSSPLRFGEPFKAEVKIAYGSLSAEDIGMEVVFANKKEGRKDELLFVEPLKLKSNVKGVATFHCEFNIDHAGLLDYAIRMFPQNVQVVYKQETGLLRYI